MIKNTKSQFVVFDLLNTKLGWKMDVTKYRFMILLSFLFV